MDHDLEAEHHRLAQLTTILGYAQLSQRRIRRSPTITVSERTDLLRAISEIEEAAKALHQELMSLPPHAAQPHTN